MNEETTTNTKAFPLHKYNGNALGYPNYKVELLAWTVRKDYEDFLSRTDPKTVPRDEAAETLATYTRRLTKDANTNKKIWAEIIAGYSGDASRTAIMATEFDGRAVIAAIKKQHGDMSERQVSSLVKKLHSMKKLMRQPIEDYNTEWKVTLRQMEANGMPLADAHGVQLYILSLSDEYKTLASMVQVIQTEDKTLDKIMQLAVDQHIPDSDEQDNSDVAMLAKLQQAGYTVTPPNAGPLNWTPKPSTENRISTRCNKRKWQATAYSATGNNCSICHSFYHQKDECFRAGGGLSHLSAKERAAHIEKKRQERGWRGPTPAPTPALAPATAHLAQIEQLKDDLRSANDELKNANHLLAESRYETSILGLT